MSKNKLKNRIILTTITLGDNQERVFFSSGGRDGDFVYMRQDFSIKSSVNVGTGGLHTAEIKLFNLSDSTARELESEGTLIRLEAGYEGATNVIFEGRISSITRTKLAVLEPDIIITLFCVSGLTQLKQASFSETIVREDLRVFLGRLATRIGLTAIIDEDVIGTIVKRTFDSDAGFILSELSAEFSFNYYWTERTMYIKKIKKEIEIVKTYKPTDGILDIPVITERGVDLKVFLDPNIRNGDGFALDSQFVNFEIGGLNFIDRIRGFEVNTANRQINNGRYQGTYQVLELEHTGSSHENTWETFIKSIGVRSQQILKNELRVENS
jgi:hypothetical protein